MYQDDLWSDSIAYPNDAEGNPAYAPFDPSHPSWQRMSRWADLGPNGERLRSEETKWVYMHPGTGWKIWHLAGPFRAREGVALARELEGIMHPEFEIRYSAGPYTIGEIPERVDFKKRQVALGAVMNPNGNPERTEPASWWSYRMIEQDWWQSWSETVPGFLGCFTRTHGWRWLRIIQGEPTKTTLSTDPVANGNNGITWNMVAHAPWPFYSKKSLTGVWKASQDQIDVHGIAQGIIPMANRGTWESWPKYLIRGTGTAQVQDGLSGRMITLPKLYAEDGAYMLVDTDPTKRTITTEKEPIDNEAARLMRNTQLLQVLLPDVYDTAAAKLPAQRRIPGGIGFDGKIPPRTVAQLKVSHTNPRGSITCIMPQHYRMPWA